MRSLSSDLCHSSDASILNTTIFEKVTLMASVNKQIFVFSVEKHTHIHL